MTLFYPLPWVGLLLTARALPVGTREPERPARDQAEWNNWGTPMDLQPPLPSRVVDSTTVTSA